MLIGAVAFTALSIAQLGLDPVTDALAAADIGSLVGTGVAIGASALGVPAIVLGTDAVDVDVPPVVAADMLAAESTRGRTSIVTSLLAWSLGGERAGSDTDPNFMEGTPMGNRFFDLKVWGSKGATWIELKNGGDPVTVEETLKDAFLISQGKDVEYAFF